MQQHSRRIGAGKVFLVEWKADGPLISCVSAAANVVAPAVPDLAPAAVSVVAAGGRCFSLVAAGRPLCPSV